METLPPAAAPLPTTVRAAAWVLALYGVLVLVHATVAQSLGGWRDAGDYPRAVVRCLGLALVAWGLFRRRRWAWWTAVGLSGFWLVAGLAGVTALLLLAGERPPLPGSALTATVVGAALLAVALGLLLAPTSRAAFRAPAS